MPFRSNARTRRFCGSALVVSSGYSGRNWPEISEILNRLPSEKGTPEMCEHKVFVLSW